MPSDENEYFEPINAIKFSQGKYNFYVFKINARDLLKIAYTSPRTKTKRDGIQRGLDERRLKEIGAYVQINKTPNLLPNAIIVNFSDKTYFKDGKLHIFKPKDGTGEAFILDGQHRLFAFDPKYSGDVSFDLIIASFIGMDREACAYLFRDINEKQKKINPSLVYDLIPMLRKEWVNFEDERCQYLIDSLNSDYNSPWFEGISMLGGRDTTITLSSFLTRLKTLFKKDKIFYNQKEGKDDFYFSTIQYDLIVQYFSAVKEVYPEAWLNKRYILCKNTGVAVLINILNNIVDNMKRRNIKITSENGLLLEKNDFIKYINKIKTFSFGGEYKTRYLGEAGIRELSRELNQKIFN